MALQPLELKAALSLAALVLDFEAENSQAAEWRAECRRAKLSIDAAIKRPPAGQFFTSAAERPHKLKSNNHSKKTEESMSHLILHDSKLNKDYKVGVSDTISRAEFTAGIEAVLSELNALVARHGPTLGAKKELKGINAVLKQLEAMTAKDKPTPAQPAPLFADNRAGLGEALHRTGSFDVTLVKAAAAKDKNYNGDNKR